MLTADSTRVSACQRQLDEFVFALCEASGIRTCPRPAAVNVRNRASARALLRDVAAAARAQDQAKAKAAAGTSQGTAEGVLAHPLEPVAPNVSYTPHTQAVEEMGWLDRWFHAEARAVPHTPPPAHAMCPSCHVPPMPRTPPPESMVCRSARPARSPTASEMTSLLCFCFRAAR